jgi:hypothetical protein
MGLRDYSIKFVSLMSSILIGEDAARRGVKSQEEAKVGTEIS